MAFVFRLWSKIKPARCKFSDLDLILYFRTQNEIEPFSNRERLIIDGGELRLALRTASSNLLEH